MPIGGFVVNVHPDHIEEAKEELIKLEGLEVHASDEKGNVIVVLDTKTANDMEQLVKEMMKIETVLSVGLTYLNAEDEIET